MKKKLTILGSTGSIGRNTMEVIRRFPDLFQVTALAAKSDIETLSRQIERFSPEIAVVYDEETAKRLKEKTAGAGKTDILWGDSGYEEAARHPDTDMVVSAIVGGAGLRPTLAAIDSGKEIALANKETLVMAGDIVMRTAGEKGIRILPVDSEHSAIFQCLEKGRKEELDKIFLTASGGPFLNFPRERFPEITPEKALNHPTWKMGKKISIDSATLMNKGLEVIEAKHLFQVDCERIEVLVHPESIIHSMVGFQDGSIIAQLGIPDMKTAIAYALSFPFRLPLQQPYPDFAMLEALKFQKPDMEKFMCLTLAFQACSEGGTLPAVMNAANEIAVEAFLDEKIPFTSIPEAIETVMLRHKPQKTPDLDGIIQADSWARKETGSWVMEHEKGR